MARHTTGVSPSLYTTKKALLAPRTAYYRRRHTDLDPFGRAMLETQYYRPTMLRFMQAVGADPDLLTTADLDRDSVVLDVGAYHGEWCLPVSARYGATIHAFEPSPPACRDLEPRLRSHPNITLHKVGLAARDATVPLAVTGPGASVYAADDGATTRQVVLRDVARVLDELGVDQVDLLKLNIEGGEFDVLDRLAATGWLPRIRLISVQFHEWHPHAYRRRRTARAALRHSHDEVWCYPWVWELWRRRIG